MTETADAPEVPRSVMVDGIEYLPADTETGTSTPRIGVAVTTHNKR